MNVRNIDQDKSYVIEAHRHPVQCIAMDYMGNLLASASTKGTLVRVFILDGEGTVLQEVRRGIDNASIMSITFNLTGQMLGVSSDSGTVHLFKIKEISFGDDGSITESQLSIEENKKKKKKGTINKKSRLRFLKKAFSYFKSEWSFRNVRVKEKHVMVDFNNDSSDVIIYVKHGKIYKAVFEMDQKNRKSVFKLISKVNLVYGNVTQLNK